MAWFLFYFMLRASLEQHVINQRPCLEIDEIFSTMRRMLLDAHENSRAPNDQKRISNLVQGDLGPH